MALVRDQFTAGFQNCFYQAPVPLLRGNLPFGDDFKNHKGQYFYKKYWIVPTPRSRNSSSDNQLTNQSTSTTLQQRMQSGVLHYSQFFKKPVLVTYNQFNFGCFYPGFFINHNGNAYIDTKYFHLNPFVNGNSGCCQWITEFGQRLTNASGTRNFSCPSNASSIYYNFQKNCYQWGLGQKFFHNGDYCYHAIHKKSFRGPPPSNYGTNDYTTTEVYTLISDPITNLKQFKEYSINYQTSVKKIGYARQFGNYNNETFDWQQFTNVDNICPDVSNTSKTFSARIVNQDVRNWLSKNSSYSGNIYYKQCRLLAVPALDNQNLIYRTVKGVDVTFLRTDQLKDLDHESDKTVPQLCGLYQNLTKTASKLRHICLGSFVLGNETNKDLGWFIGHNQCINYGYVPGDTDKSTSSFSPKSCFGQRSNVIPVARNTELSFTDGMLSSAVPGDYQSYVVVLGYAWKSQKNKFLVYYHSKEDQKPIKGNRVYIVEDYPTNLYKAKELWFAELPNQSWDSRIDKNCPELFRWPFKTATAGQFQTLKFNKLDVETGNEGNEEIEFSIIGMCRENAYQQLMGAQISWDFIGANQWVTGSHNNSQYSKTSYDSMGIKTNTYIGYWDVPVVQFKKQEQE